MAGQQGHLPLKKNVIEWQAFVDRENGIFVIHSPDPVSELDLFVREEWGISPRLYMDEIRPEKYIDDLPPKPIHDTVNDICLIQQKLMARGAHVVASRLLEDETG